MREVVLCAALLLMVFPALAEPILPSAIQITDGDTIRTAGENVRLIGFDAPETYRAQCDDERALGNEATERLRQLVTAGKLDFRRVSCNCRPGTEGTASCNHGRACGILTSGGVDVGQILIGAGLARPYVCSGYHCPRRQPWCDQSIVAPAVGVATLTVPTHRRGGGCGSRGGSGYRLPSGKCAAHHHR